MLRLVVQFDLVYEYMKAHWLESGGIPEQEGLELMRDGRQAVQAFATFMDEFKERVGYTHRGQRG
jgi:hypothetical protein